MKTTKIKLILEFIGLSEFSYRDFARQSVNIFNSVTQNKHSRTILASDVTHVTLQVTLVAWQQWLIDRTVGTLPTWNKNDLHV